MRIRYIFLSLYRVTKRKYNDDMIHRKHTRERGEISGLQVTVIGLAVLVLGLGSFGIWAFVSYQDAQQNVDSKIDVAVANGKKDQQDEDETKFSEREKEPNKTFKGPDDYCGLTFNYPKTWSAYEANDIKNGGDYEAYLSKDIVKPVSADQQYALRVLIEQKDFDDVTKQYDPLVAKGSLHNGVTTSEGQEGLRLDGNFSKNIRGAAVIYKCRAYTITLRTDADTFKPDFEKIIRTISYNQ
jgi:cytoskeletal protein RodZ